MRDLRENQISVGALAGKGGKTDLLSSSPALRSRNPTFPISNEVPKIYVVNIILDDVNIDLPSSPPVFRADADAGIWHRRMRHCNAGALKQLSDKEGTSIKFTTNIRRPDDEVWII